MPEGKYGFPRLTDVGPFVESSTKGHIYRGADIDTLREQILEDRTIDGQVARIIRATPKYYRADVDRGTRLTNVEWEKPADRPTFREDRVGVTGGMTDSIAATRRFRDSLNMIAVFDPADTPFNKVRYEYDWMNDQEGALVQILTTAVAELRTPEGLWATLNKGLEVDGTEFLKISEWEPGNLPATTSGSAFAEESEWIAFQEQVDITESFRGIVSLQSEKGISVKARSMFDDVNDLLPADDMAVPVYNEIQSMLGDYSGPFFMLVFPGKKVPNERFIRDDSVEFAVVNGEIVDPERVPSRFKGA